MTDDPRKLTRRELLKAGAAVAGGAVLAPAAGLLVPQRCVAGGFPGSIAPSRAKRPNVLFIVLDTVRADHMSCYGHHRETTPHIDAFAEQARMYTNVLSPGCWTLPTHASMFTGLAGSAHGANWHHCYLDPRLDTLAQQLLNSGYQTVGLSGNQVIVCPSSGLARGFETFHVLVEPIYRTIQTWIRSELGAPGDTPVQTKASRMHGKLGAWFAERYDPGRPFFCFLNYFEAHAPYVPPLSFRRWTSAETRRKWATRDQLEQFFAHMLTGMDILSANEIDEFARLYDEEIAYVDSMLGELFGFLDRTGLADNTLIIITSDHGEHFGEHHMMGHQYSLYEPLVRVPLIIRWAGRIPSGRDGALVQSHDVYPTVLQAAGLPWEPRPEQNCRTLLSPGQTDDRLAFSEYVAPMMSQIHTVATGWPGLDVSRFTRRLRAVQAGDLKLIRPSEGEAELYDLSADPLELRDLAADRPEKVKELSGKLDDWLNSFPHYQYQPPAPEQLKKLDPQELERMRGLGYV